MSDEETPLTAVERREKLNSKCIGCYFCPLLVVIGGCTIMSIVFAQLLSDNLAMRAVASYPEAECTILQGAKVDKISYEGMWGVPYIEPSSVTTNITVVPRVCGKACINYVVMAPVTVRAGDLAKFAVAYRDAKGTIGSGIDGNEAMAFAVILEKAAKTSTPMTCWYDDSHTPWQAVILDEPPPLLASRYGEINTWGLLVVSLLVFGGSAVIVFGYLRSLFRDICPDSCECDGEEVSSEEE